MAPKKAPKEAEEARDLPLENLMLERRVQTLQHKLMVKEEQLRKSRESTDRLRLRMEELNKDFLEERSRGGAVNTDMRRQFLEMETNFTNIINNLSEQVVQSKRQIESVQAAIEKEEAVKGEIIAKKDLEIKRVQAQMDAMAYEFGEMLKSTLDKMSERIEMSHSCWDRQGFPGSPGWQEALGAGVIPTDDAPLIASSY